MTATPATFGERIPCPLCGGEFPVPTHPRGTHWTVQQIWLVRRMRYLGMSYGGIGRLFGVDRQTVASAIERAQPHHAAQRRPPP